MIRMPRRSVTRFFIPMIDVLTLLFCIFLLMPIIRENESLSQESPGVPAADDLKREVDKQQAHLQELYADEQRARAMLRELAEKKREVVRQSVLIKLLYISPKDGSLRYSDLFDLNNPSFLIDNAKSAADLIAKHKVEAGDRELFYIFQEPRDERGQVAPYPTRLQETRYKEWFSGVNYDGCVRPPPGGGVKK